AARGGRVEHPLLKNLSSKSPPSKPATRSKPARCPNQESISPAGLLPNNRIGRTLTRYPPRSTNPTICMRTTRSIRSGKKQQTASRRQHQNNNEYQQKGGVINWYSTKL
ncbi:unnamed protein product, partial [Ectocarpus sp. 6 AP-2014]